MIISVASGKGGTGKTSVAVSLALCLDNVQFLDCDVEEPNASIFLKPAFLQKEAVTIPVPEIDESRCTHCGKCSALCAYNAVIDLGKRMLVFPHLCHGCGGCTLACDQKAVTEKSKEIGTVERGQAGAICFMQGTLNVGEPMATPVIKRLWKLVDPAKTAILDSPPGTSCPVIETVRGSDFCILVTEPTPFGLNDLKLAVETVRELAVPFGVVINSAGIGNDDVKDYCWNENISLLMEIPWDRRIAEGYSRGEPLITVLPEMKKDFLRLYDAIQSLSANLKRSAINE